MNRVIFITLLLFIPALFWGQGDTYTYETYCLSINQNDLIDEAYNVEKISTIIILKDSQELNLIFDVFTSRGDYEVYFTNIIGGGEIVACVIREDGEPKELLLNFEGKITKYEVFKSTLILIEKF